MSVLSDIERLCDEVYGKGSAVSVDQAKHGPGWVVRCWDRKGTERSSTMPPLLSKTVALATMRRRLQRQAFLRLDASDMGLSDG